MTIWFIRTSASLLKRFAVPVNCLSAEPDLKGQGVFPFAIESL